MLAEIKKVIFIMQNYTQTLSHFVDIIRQQSEKLSQRTELRYFDHQHKLQDMSWQSFHQQSEQLSRALLTLGIGVQDKIGIFAQNMPQWTIADIAILQIRAVTVPI